MGKNISFLADCIMFNGNKVIGDFGLTKSNGGVADIVTKPIDWNAILWNRVFLGLNNRTTGNAIFEFIGTRDFFF